MASVGSIVTYDHERMDTRGGKVAYGQWLVNLCVCAGYGIRELLPWDSASPFLPYAMTGSGAERLGDCAG